MTNTGTNDLLSNTWKLEEGPHDNDDGLFPGRFGNSNPSLGVVGSIYFTHFVGLYLKFWSMAPRCRSHIPRTLDLEFKNSFGQLSFTEKLHHFL